MHLFSDNKLNFDCTFFSSKFRFKRIIMAATKKQNITAAYVGFLVLGVSVWCLIETNIWMGKNIICSPTLSHEKNKSLKT